MSYDNNKNQNISPSEWCDPEDLFDINKYLPIEIDDWFDVQSEPISIKNKNLINLSKPNNIDPPWTDVGFSRLHPIRHTPAEPKTVVSPWLQNEIKPDTNLKPLT